MRRNWATIVLALGVITIGHRAEERPYPLCWACTEACVVLGTIAVSRRPARSLSSPRSRLTSRRSDAPGSCDNRIGRAGSCCRFDGGATPGARSVAPARCGCDVASWERLELLSHRPEPAGAGDRRNVLVETADPRLLVHLVRDHGRRRPRGAATGPAHGREDGDRVSTRPLRRNAVLRLGLHKAAGPCRQDSGRRVLVLGTRPQSSPNAVQPRLD